MRRLSILLGVFLPFLPSNVLFAKSVPPLKFIAAYKLPSMPPGHFDHMMVKGDRLFVTPEAANEELVFNARTGKLLHTIPNIPKPHAPFYRSDVNDLYITYGGRAGAPGGLKIFNGQTYKLIRSVSLFPHADAMAYDARTHCIFINDGGGPALLPYGRIRVINANTMKTVATFKVPGGHLKRMVLNPSGSKLYVDDVAQREVDVIDTSNGKILARWPVRTGKLNIPLALDAAHHRLFVGCRSGVIAVFDTKTGKELQALPIGKGIDDLIFDPATRRLYASCGAGRGQIDVYREVDPDHFQLLGREPTAPGAKTGILAPSLKMYFVAVPEHSGTPARVFAYDVL